MEYEDHIHYVCGSPEMVRIPKGAKVMLNKAITDERPNAPEPITCFTCHVAMVWHGTSLKGAWQCPACKVIETPNQERSIVIALDGQVIARALLPHISNDLRRKLEPPQWLPRYEVK